LFAALFGDARHFALEHRLFNTVSLLNAITNIVGAVTMVKSPYYFALLALQLSTGILFLCFYYVSRFRAWYRALYWPFVLLMVIYLVINAMLNAGSIGGAHYYFIPALVIATMLSVRMRTTIFAFIIFGATAIGIAVLEYVHPEWIIMHSNPRERFIDVATNFFFAQIFTGVLVMVLTRNLNQERKKSDQLLLNILPESIAAELKKNDRVPPLHYKSASVIFTDLVGFTGIAERLSPPELIAELDGFFRHFDQIVRRHNLEKIKTIGDAYMAAGGIPAPNHTHAIDSVLAALEIHDYMAEMRAQKMAAGRPCWELRLGIHSGPLVAGVIGQEKFAYDIWGDTVNTASRMESSGVAGRINISGATYELIKDFFVCEYRGKVAAKNKGDIDMYFVNGIRPELSAYANRFVPNERFAELYNYLALSVSIAP
jgi:adenylate cyclase